MRISETEITMGILNAFAGDFSATAATEVAIAGAGPAGITAAYFLAEKGHKVNVFEKNLHVGGGMWGGGMLFPRIVLERDIETLLDEMGVTLGSLEPYQENYLVADSVEVVSKCTAAAYDAGAKIWVGMTVEDVIVREEERVSGVVLNWTAVDRAGFHVDPLGLECRLVIDATGHDSEVAKTLVRKVPGARLSSMSGGVEGEMPMWAEKGERELVDNTVEIYPGLLVAGMSAAAVRGSPRMGAIFGGMFQSGKKAAKLAIELLDKSA